MIAIENPNPPSSPAPLVPLKARVLAFLRKHPARAFVSTIAVGSHGGIEATRRALRELETESLVSQSSNGWCVGRKPRGHCRVAPTADAAMVLKCLRDATAPMRLGEIGAVVELNPQRVGICCRWLSDQGKARKVISNGWGAWVSDKVVLLKRRAVGHMLEEHGERDETCARYRDCLAVASREEWEAARCPGECTNRRLAKSTELADFALSQREVV